MRRPLLALSSSALFVAAFPPSSLGPLALVALAPLLLALEGARRPFLLGWLAGWAAFTGVVWWVYYAMTHFGGIPPFVSVPLMLLMRAGMALFWGGFGWAYERLRRTLPRADPVEGLVVE